MRRIGCERYLLLLVAVVCADVFACSCRPDDQDAQTQKAELVFVGSPVMLEELRTQPPVRSAWGQVRATLATLFGAPPAPTLPRHDIFLDSVRVTFEVSDYLKGSGPRRLQIMTGYGDADCGLRVALAKRYTIYARRADGALRTSYCFGSEDYVPPRPKQMCEGTAQ